MINLKNNKNSLADYELFMANWIKGIEGEISFWSDWLKNDGNPFQYEYKRLTSNNVNFRYPELIDKLPCKVLDVGSSLLPGIGNVTPLGHIDLSAVDPLAPLYDCLLIKYNIEPYVRTQFAMVEILDDKFEKNSFDLITMTNALDHCFNPLIGIYQMLNLVKLNKKVFLVHADNEAEMESYTGFHQWNISCDENNCLIIWNKKIKYNMSEMLKDVAIIKTEKEPFYCSVHKKDRFFIKTTLTKIADVDLTEFKKQKIEILEFFVKLSAHFTSHTYKNTKLEKDPIDTITAIN